MAITLRTLAILTVALVVGTAWAQTSPSVGDVLQLLRAGGYVIVFRHGATHADQADTDPLNLDNVAKQRQLNDKGRADAKAVGEVVPRPPRSRSGSRTPAASTAPWRRRG